jgi:hypothetical protein
VARAIKLTVRVSQAENDTLVAAAKQCGFKYVGEYVRNAALGVQLKPVMDRDLIDALLGIEQRLADIPPALTEVETTNGEITALLSRLERTRYAIHRKLGEL